MSCGHAASNVEVAVENAERSLQPMQAPAPSPPPHSFSKDTTVTEYEAQLRTIKRLALFSTCLYCLNWFLGLSALTWASLGSFLTQLREDDFYSVSALLLLEVLRLAAATFFGNLVTRKLIYKSTLPAHMKYDDKERHLILETARIVDPIVQLLVLAVSIYLPLSRLPSTHLPRHLYPQQEKSLHLCLRVFYMLILLNACVAGVGVLHSKVLVPWFTTSFSLRRYYDHVVWRGIHKGLLHSTDFDFLAFAFKALADEYRRNLRATVVYKLYHDLITYLYSHKHGYDAARIAMDSSDHCEQEAAANLVGLWAAQIEGAGSSLLLQSRLLTKLADALDHQETGRAATCSFESLAKSNAEGVLEVENGREEKMMVILSKCIGKAVKAKKEDKALVFMKVLIQLLGSEAGRQEAAAMQERMVEDLRMVFKGNGCKKRTVGVAGKALKLMGQGPSEEEVDKWLRIPLPSEQEHILEDEEGYLLELLSQDSLPSMWNKAQVRGNTSPRASAPCAYSRMVSILPIVVAIIVFYKTSSLFTSL